MSADAPLAIGGHRLTWPELPEAVRVALEMEFGASVVSALSMDGGFSPGMASVLTLADGTTAFAKAISVSRNDFTAAAIRRETQVLAGLAGLFVSSSLQPVPPLLPTIREFQRAQGLVALDWLSRRMGWT